MENIFNWFDENYLEEKASIYKIIDDACTKHTRSIQSLFESCQMMKQYNPDKRSLRYEVKYLAKMSYYGMIGYDAGKNLRTFFDVNHIINSK